MRPSGRRKRNKEKEDREGKEVLEIRVDLDGDNEAKVDHDNDYF